MVALSSSKILEALSIFLQLSRTCFTMRSALLLPLLSSFFFAFASRPRFLGAARDANVSSSLTPIPAASMKSETCCLAWSMSSIVKTRPMGFSLPTPRESSSQYFSVSLMELHFFRTCCTMTSTLLSDGSGIFTPALCSVFTSPFLSSSSSSFLTSSFMPQTSRQRFSAPSMSALVKILSLILSPFFPFSLIHLKNLCADSISEHFFKIELVRYSSFDIGSSFGFF
mmetsp:Transcript_17472/g.31101  ORF Transcript_17472/g.31101 Transcript_17472/m.31101 type:complete len:226 (+) Transcript_17472:5288-5965(+)